MKRLLILLLFVTVRLAAQAVYTNPTGQTITSQDAGTCSTVNTYVWQHLPANANTTTVNLAGTFNGTVTIRLSNNGGGTWTTNTTTSSAGTTTVSTNGYTDICADVTTYTSGGLQISVSTGLLQVQSVVSGSGGITQVGDASPILPDQAHLIAFNQFLDDTGATIATDSSGNGNTCTFAGGGNAPTMLAKSAGGGVSFTGSANQFCSFPAALNAAKTVIWAIRFSPSDPANSGNPLVRSHSDSTTAVQLLAGSSAATANNLLLIANLNGGIVNVYYNNTSQGAFLPASQKIGATLGAVNSLYSATSCAPEGTVILGFSMAAPDAWYLNGSPCIIMGAGGGNTAVQAGGVYQLGASSAISGQMGFTGIVYAHAAWSSILTTAQFMQASQTLQANLNQRGIATYLGGSNAFVGTPTGQNPSANDTNDRLVIDGDSLVSEQNWPLQDFPGAPVYVADAGIGATTLDQMVARFTTNVAPLLHPAAARNAVIIWGGTNDATGWTNQQSLAIYANYCQQVHKIPNTKCIIATMVSRVGADARKDSWNPMLMQYWPTFADAIVPLHMNVHYGADSAYSNTTYFNADQVHLQPFSDTNFIGPYFIDAFNRLFGNTSASGTFNIYAGTGSAAPRVLQSIDCGSQNNGATCAFPFPTTAGSALFYVNNCWNTCNGITINAPTDTQTSTWAAVAATYNYTGTQNMRAFYACTSAGGTETVTTNQTGGSGNVSMVEVPGVLAAACLDVAATQNVAGNVQTITTNSITPGTNGDILLAYGFVFPLGVPPIGVWWNPASPFVLANNNINVGILSAYQPTAAAVTTVLTQAYQPTYNPPGSGMIALKPAATTSTFQLQPWDVYSECNTTSGSVTLILQDGISMGGQEVTIHNNTQAAGNTCTISAPTPYRTAVQQTIDGAASVTIANKATAKFRPKYTFTGVAGTNLSPVVTWVQTQ